MRKYLTIFFVAVLLVTSCIIPAYGASKTVEFSLNNSDAGRIYWLLDKEGNYAFMDYSPGKYNKECLITPGKEYKTGLIKQSMFVVRPNSGYYLKGFSNGKKSIKLTKGLYNIIQMNVGGLPYYDFFLSNKDSVYRYLTVSAYDELVKEYVKATYGTSSYKVLDTFSAYSIDGYRNIKVNFAKKSEPKLTFPDSIKAKVKDETINKLCDPDRDYDLHFKSSNTKCCTIDKETGLITIKSEGISTITITADPSEEINGKTYKVKLKVMPQTPKINKISTKNKSITLSWTKDEHASGYKIMVGNKHVTVNSPKTLSKTIKSLTKGKSYTVKIRSYKKSSGEYLYSAWSKAKKITVK